MKLIDLLVKELPKRGGWPEGVTHIGQDYDRELMFYGRGDVRTGVILNELAIDHRKCGEVGEKITRDQYESALAASKSVVGHDDWIQWAGGDCPVDSDAIVEVRFRNQNQNHYQYNNDRAGDFEWEHIGSNCDIIAYRLHTPDVNNRANDDRLEQDLNECIGQGVTSEWDGEGLPPVGCECEVKRAIDWVKCKILFISEAHVVLMADEECCWNTCACQFRPLRTEAEKAREAAETAMRTCLAGTGAGITPLAAKGIYEAIAEGKIPGVKLEDK